MLIKNTFLIFSAIFLLIILSVEINFHRPKKVEGASTSATTPAPSATAHQDKIPQGKFYAPILLYHHIADRKIQNSYYVSPKIFDEQMGWLKENDYHIISIDDLYEAGLGKKGLPEKPVVISFDDGVTDQFTNGLPILEKYGYTATFFIKLNNVGRGKGGLTYDQIKELIASDMTIGSHSVNHDNMALMDLKTLDYELRESKKILEENLGIKIKYFSFPGGAYTQTTIKEVKLAGYLAAVTTKHRVNQEIKKPDDIFTLPRVHIDDEMPTFIDWVQGKNLN